jgi:uncharacterized protein YjlB
MTVAENLKKTAELITGIGKPSLAEAKKLVRRRRPKTYRLRRSGLVPNNPVLPFVVYKGAVSLRAAADPAAIFETLFDANHWRDSWRDGIYDYVHYHPRIHEVLGIARGRARVQFGGARGPKVELKAGDVAILPAGTGHQALRASDDLLVVGAYPPRGSYEEYSPSKEHYERAAKSIPKVALPKRDPVYGARGPLLRAWRKRKSR